MGSKIYIPNPHITPFPLWVCYKNNETNFDICTWNTDLREDLTPWSRESDTGGHGPGTKAMELLRLARALR